MRLRASLDRCLTDTCVKAVLDVNVNLRTGSANSINKNGLEITEIDQVVNCITQRRPTLHKGK